LSSNIIVIIIVKYDYYYRVSVLRVAGDVASQVSHVSETLAGCWQ